MRKRIPLAIFLGLIVGLSAILPALAGRPPVEPPPQHYDPPPLPYTEEDFDAVWLAINYDVVFDGEKIVHRVHKKLRVLTERGADRYLEVEIRYNRHCEQLEVEEIKTILPDGTELIPMEDAVHDVPLVRQRVYSDARKRIFDMPGVAVGSTVEYTYTITEMFPMPGEFQDWCAFQDWMPTREVEYTLTVPEDFLLYLDWDVLMTNGIEELPLTFTTEGSTYIWRGEKIPGIHPEPGMPDYESVAPAILISSLDSWDQIGDWWMTLLGEAIVPTPVIEEKVAGLVAGLKTSEERIAAIYHWVIQNTKYVGLEFGIGGFKPYPAATTFENGYGDCKDGTALLVTMLRIAGEEAYPVLINATGDVRPDLPVLWFDHAIAAVPLDEKRNGSEWLFLDTTAWTNSYGDVPISDQAKWALIAGLEDGSRHELVQSPLYPAEWNHWRVSQELHLAGDGELTAMVHWESSGFYNMYWRWLFKSLSEGQKRYFFESYASLLVPGARVEWYKVSDLNDYQEPVQISMLMAGQGAQFYNDGKLMSFKIPMTIGPQRGLVKEVWRYYPFLVGLPSKVEQSTVVSLPAGWEINSMPEGFIIASYWGGILIDYNTDGRTLLVSNITEAASYKELPRRMYNGYVEAQDEYARHLQLPILLKKSGR